MGGGCGVGGRPRRSSRTLVVALAAAPLGLASGVRTALPPGRAGLMPIGRGGRAIRLTARVNRPVQLLHSLIRSLPLPGTTPTPRSRLLRAIRQPASMSRRLSLTCRTTPGTTLGGATPGTTLGGAAAAGSGAIGRGIGRLAARGGPGGLRTTASLLSGSGGRGDGLGGIRLPPSSEHRFAPCQHQHQHHQHQHHHTTHRHQQCKRCSDSIRPVVCQV